MGGVSFAAIAAGGSVGSLGDVGDVETVASVVAISAAVAGEVEWVGVIVVSVMVRETDSCCRLFGPTVDQRGFSGATGQPVS